jgi:hypothetical protein
MYGNLALQVGGGLEYLHCSPASRKRQCKGYGNLALQLGGVSDETVKYGYGF